MMEVEGTYLKVKGEKGYQKVHRMHLYVLKSAVGIHLEIEDGRYIDVPLGQLRRLPKKGDQS